MSKFGTDKKTSQILRMAEVAIEIEMPYLLYDFFDQSDEQEIRQVIAAQYLLKTLKENPDLVKELEEKF